MSQLAEWALAAAAAAKEQERAVLAAAEKYQQELRDEFTQSYMAVASPLATEAVARLFDLPADAPMFAELTWRIDPSDFRGVTFARDDEGMAKPQLGEGQHRLLGGGKRFQLIADIDVVSIAATETSYSGAPVVHLAVHDRGSSSELRDVAQLGAIIQARREHLSQAPRRNETD